MSVDRDIRKSYRNRQGIDYKSLHEYGFSGMENTTAVEFLPTPKKKAELQSARVMDRIVSESIDPDGNSDEELDDLRRKLKETEDGIARQKEEDKLVMKRQKEEEKARLRKQIEENQHTLETFRGENDLKLDQLGKMETLNRKVDKQLNKLGLGESYLDESIQYSENREVDFRKTVFRDTADSPVL